MSVAVALEPVLLTSLCAPECTELGTCSRCAEPLCCEHIDDAGPVNCPDGEVCRDCHVAGCRLRECWDDPDTAWNSRHE